MDKVLNYLKEDWSENPYRCALEIFAWILSIGCSILMAMTVPNPPFLLLYPLFILQCAIFGWAAYTRRSTGMLMNYTLLVGIDSIALFRLVTN